MWNQRQETFSAAVANCREFDCMSEGSVTDMCVSLCGLERVLLGVRGQRKSVTVVSVDVRGEGKSVTVVSVDVRGEGKSVTVVSVDVRGQRKSVTVVSVDVREQRRSVTVVCVSLWLERVWFVRAKRELFW